MHAIDILIDAEPPEWRDMVFSKEAWWFRLSCGPPYSLLGIQILLYLDVLQRHAWRYFPWTFVGLQLVLQGMLSYQADVITFGRKSAWKAADCAGASTCSLLAVAIPLLQLAGLSTYPSRMALLLAVATACGLGCKYFGTQCLRAGRRAPAKKELGRQFFRWHTAWHLVIPIGASAAIAQL